MLAYRHQFHAGNFADVFKHALLVQLLVTLQNKDKPLVCLDTHAGIGRYDLTHEWARKNAEHAHGIGRLWERTDAPAGLARYLELVRGENPDGQLRWYPGSPVIMRHLLRPADRMIVNELNRKDHEALAALFVRDRQVKVQFGDGYQALKAYLPPPERRGLVLIDSSFDRARELQRLTQGLADAHRKFANGVYALWYPLMDTMSMHGFDRGLRATGIRRLLQLELAVHPENWTLGMRGCGVIVVNPPFGFDEAAAPVVAYLASVLKQSAGARLAAVARRSHRVTWLVPE